MATSHYDAALSRTSAFACAMRRRVGFLQKPSPGEVGQVPVVSNPPGPESTTSTDSHDVSSHLSSPASGSNGDRNDVASRGIPMFCMAQLNAAFVQLYLLVSALIIQVTVIASDVVSLRDRVTAVEGTRMSALVHGQETEALTRQVNALRERVVSQEDHIAVLERLQRAETVTYKKIIQGLTARLDNEKKTRNDVLENFRQSFQTLQQLTECEAARVTGIKADTARKMALLQSELAAVQTELAMVKMVAVPVNVASAGQVAREARKARILASVAQRMEDATVAEEIEKLCPLPPVVARSLARTTVSQDTPADPTSSGSSRSPTTLPNHSKETKVKKLETTKEPLTNARSSAIQPGADKISKMSMIPTKPLAKIPMECAIPAKGSGKENKPRNSPTTTLQYTKMFQPGAGRVPDVSDEPHTASCKKAQLVARSSPSALPMPRRSMLPAPRKLQLPSLAKHVAAGDGSAPNEVKTANRPPGGSETRTKQPRTVRCSPIAPSRAPSESPQSTLVENEPPALSASSSLESLDAALQAMQREVDELLAPVPALDYSKNDLSFSPLPPISTKTRRKRDDKCESTYIPPKDWNVDVKPLRSPKESTMAENEVPLPKSSPPTAVDASRVSQGKGDNSMLSQGPNCPTVDFSKLWVVPPIFQAARPHCKRESIYVSPLRTKPSRRL